MEEPMVWLVFLRIAATDIVDSEAMSVVVLLHSCQDKGLLV